MYAFELLNALEMHDHLINFEDVPPYGEMFLVDSPQIVDAYLELEHIEQ